MSEPLVPEVGVVALVPDRWQPQWQSRHHVLSRLARYFRVVWVEPARGWRDALRGQPEPPERPPLPKGLSVLTEQQGPPHFFRPAAVGVAMARLRLARARRRLTGAGCRQIVVYLWRPEFAEALDRIRFDLSCYHVDDEYRFYDAPEQSDERERSLLARVDQVFIHSLALLRKKGDVNPHTEHVPNGVDYAAYASAQAEPADLACLPRPRVGYVGTLKRQNDWSALRQLARDRREGSLVLVGPIGPHAEAADGMAELEACDNVHWLGAKAARELPGYVQHLDVCLMPYQLDGYTQFIYPLKLHELLATGRPVVATRLPSLEEFADVIDLVDPGEPWAPAIERALGAAANDPDTCERRRAVARRHDWELLVHRIAHTMAGRLSPPLGERVRAAAPEAGGVARS